MATLLDFRRRIRSVKNTQQITRAMKFVAAARLRRAQEAALAARPYAVELARVLRSTMARIRIASASAAGAARRKQHSGHRADRRTRLGRRVQQQTFCAKPTNFSARTPAKKSPPSRSAKKAAIRCDAPDSPSPANTSTCLARVDFKTAREIANLAADFTSKEEIDSVYIIFSEFKSVMTPNLAVEKLLPVEKMPSDDAKTIAPRRRAHGDKKQVQRQRAIDYIYEQPEEHILAKLLAALRRNPSPCAPCWNLPRPNTPRA